MPSLMQRILDLQAEDAARLARIDKSTGEITEPAVPVELLEERFAVLADDVNREHRPTHQPADAIATTGVMHNTAPEAPQAPHSEELAADDSEGTELRCALLAWLCGQWRASGCTAWPGMPGLGILPEARSWADWLEAAGVEDLVAALMAVEPAAEQRQLAMEVA